MAIIEHELVREGDDEAVPPCATCGSVYPSGDMTTCDECGEALCPYDARTRTSEAVGCPSCYERYARRQARLSLDAGKAALGDIRALRR